MDEYRWWHLHEPGALAHLFPVGIAFMVSRCQATRLSIRMWPAPPDAPRCPDCAEMSDAADERVAVSAVATLAVR